MDKIAYKIGAFVEHFLSAIGANSLAYEIYGWGDGWREKEAVGYIIIVILVVLILAAIGQAVNKKS